MNYRANKIDYSDLMKLGFTRGTSPDNVFKNQHGYDYFFVYLDVGPMICFQWDTCTHHIEMLRLNESGTIVDKKLITEFNELESTLLEVQRKWNKCKNKLEKTAAKFDNFINKLYENGEENTE